MFITGPSSTLLLLTAFRDPRGSPETWGSTKVRANLFALTFEGEGHRYQPGRGGGLPWTPLKRAGMSLGRAPFCFPFQRGGHEKGIGYCFPFFTFHDVSTWEPQRYGLGKASRSTWSGTSPSTAMSSACRVDSKARDPCRALLEAFGQRLVLSPWSVVKGHQRRVV